MGRGKKLVMNTLSALAYQAVTLVCGFVLPQFVIPYFGSETNGLINSITQFLTIITLCECGIGAVVQSALYKPLAEQDNEGISRVVIASKRFFNNIMRILGVYVAIMMLVYPIIVKEDFDFFYTASLILILALSYVAQYYLFLTYRLLLNADQLSFVQLTAHSVALIINTVATIVLIKLGASVHLVKLASAAAFLIQPIIIKLYVDRHYKLDHKLPYDKNALPQKWNGLAQHVATVVHQNVATVTLTLFASLSDVSIFGVYHLVTHGVRQVIISLNTGVQAMLGNMYAKRESETLNATFSTVELTFHMLITLIFTVTGVLLIPFIRVYTKDFTDANYIIPLLGVLATLTQAAYCLRIPYEMMIKAAGHYKQTQTASIIEAVVCAVLCCAMVIQFGLVGVTVGTLVSIIYRTVYLVFYLAKNILYRKVSHFIKHIAVDALAVVLMLAATCWIKLPGTNYLAWTLMAVQVGAICLAVSMLVNAAFYRKRFITVLRSLVRKAAIRK